MPSSLESIQISDSSPKAGPFLGFGATDLLTRGEPFGEVKEMQT